MNIEKMTAAPGEVRVPASFLEEKVAVVNAARRLLDECNGDAERAVRVLRAVADA